MSNNTPDYVNNLVFISTEDGPEKDDIIEQLKNYIKKLEEENKRLKKIIETQND